VADAALSIRLQKQDKADRPAARQSRRRQWMNRPSLNPTPSIRPRLARGIDGLCFPCRVLVAQSQRVDTFGPHLGLLGGLGDIRGDCD
jgi:hypothetical protein